MKFKFARAARIVSISLTFAFLPQIAMAGDTIDAEWVREWHQWQLSNAITSSSSTSSSSSAEYDRITREANIRADSRMFETVYNDFKAKARERLVAASLRRIQLLRPEIEHFRNDLQYADCMRRSLDQSLDNAIIHYRIAVGQKSTNEYDPKMSLEERKKRATVLFDQTLGEIDQIFNEKFEQNRGPLMGNGCLLHALEREKKAQEQDSCKLQLTDARKRLAKLQQEVEEKPSRAVELVKAIRESLASNVTNNESVKAKSAFPAK